MQAVWEQSRNQSSFHLKVSRAKKERLLIFTEVYFYPIEQADFYLRDLKRALLFTLTFPFALTGHLFLRFPKACHFAKAAKIKRPTRLDR